MMYEYTIPCKAIVSYAEKEWKLQDVLLREPEEGEAIVRITAAGICHTDVTNVGGIYPRILGREILEHHMLIILLNHMSR